MTRRGKGGIEIIRSGRYAGRMRLHVRHPGPDGQKVTVIRLLPESTTREGAEAALVMLKTAIGLGQHRKRAPMFGALPRANACAAAVNTPGVYALVCEGTVVYVGQSRRVRDRLLTHRRTLRGWDAAKVVYMDPALLDFYEREMIRKHRPALNSAGITRAIGRQAGSLTPTAPSAERYALASLCG